MHNPPDHKMRPDHKMIRDIYFSGGVFAYPTEAVWGLGCDPSNKRAVRRLLDIKSRPVNKGFILITGDIAHVSPWLQSLPVTLQKKAASYWPGHTTLLIPDEAQLALKEIRGQHQSVAIRVSQHPFIQWFSKEISPLLVSTSANKAGEPSCRTFQEVQRELGDLVDYIVPGETSGSTSPSQIIDLLSGEIFRS